MKEDSTLDLNLYWIKLDLHNNNNPLTILTVWPE